MLTALAALTLTPVLSQALPAAVPTAVSEPTALESVVLATSAPQPGSADGQTQAIELPVSQPLDAPLAQPRFRSELRLAQAAGAAQQYAEVIEQQEVRPLPGQLDEIPVFNSNSPELIQTDGILLSTFPQDGMRTPGAHLNFPFQGRFDIFAHHIARGITPDDRRTLFLGVLVHNPGTQPVTLDILQGITYLSQEAPFRDLPTTVLNPNGTIYAGPGSRTTTDILRGQNQSQWPRQIVIPPGHVHLLMNVPIPLRQLTVPVNGTYPQGSIIPKPPLNPATIVAAGIPDGAAGAANGAVAPLPVNRPLPSNGRTAMMYLSSNGPVHMASLAMFAPPAPGGAERVPTLREWIDLLKRGNLAGPRDIPPTDPQTYRYGRFYYGRVAGVARGSRWSALVTDGSDANQLTIPQPGNAFSYVVSTVDRNTFGTGQIQSAPMLARYPDTAFRAHGNYGIHYSVTLPLFNPTGAAQTVALKLQTPLQDEGLKDGLRFRQPPDSRIFFRGTVRLRYANQLGVRQTHYVHLVQRRGQEGDPLVKLTIPAGERREVEVDLIYPPDATPPQVLTVQTINPFSIFEANTQSNPAQPLSREPLIPRAGAPEP
ncbi:MAG TPA: DUF3370 domain-containing protein [Trichocoleus sp.]